MEKVFVFIIGLYLMLVIFASPSLAAENIGEASANLVRNESGVDERVRKLENLLEEYNSPLKPYAQNFVQAADKYSLDWRLVAAISGVESTFGKRIPKNSYNAWGFGVPTGKQNGLAFQNWEEGIKTVSSALKEKYIDRGADSVLKIAPIYAPPSKTWAGKILFFMEKIEATTLAPKLSL